MKNFSNMPAVRVRNLLVMSGFSIISIVLAIAYVVEYLKGKRTVEYVSSYLILLVVMIILCASLYSKYKDSDTRFAYFFFTLYCIFYLYTMLSSNYIITFVYAFPMIFLSLPYGKKKVGLYATVLFTLSTCINVIYHMINNNSFDLTEIEVAVACMVLVSIFYQIGQAPIIQDLDRLDFLEEELFIDTLTKCKNRRFLDKLKEHNYFKDKGIVVMLGDINEFKQINDLYGHEYGDIALMRIGKNLLTACEGKDANVIRIGGDEFVIISRNVNPLSIIRTFRMECLDDCIMKDLPFKIDVAFGISDNSEKIKSWSMLYNEADQDMYDRKEEMKMYSYEE